MSKMAREKGKRGERMVIDWLQPILDNVCNELGIKQVILQRNTVQSDRGGSDLVGLDWLSAEVKNCEADGPAQLDKWWQQCLVQSQEFRDARGRERTPILFYTRNHRPIRVRMPGAMWAAPSPIFSLCIVDVSAEEFEAYFRARLLAELAPMMERTSA